MKSEPDRIRLLYKAFRSHRRHLTWFGVALLFVILVGFAVLVVIALCAIDQVEMWLLLLLGGLVV